MPGRQAVHVVTRVFEQAEERQEERVVRFMIRVAFVGGSVGESVPQVLLSFGNSARIGFHKLIEDVGEEVVSGSVIELLRNAVATENAVIRLNREMKIRPVRSVGFQNPVWREVILI